MRDRRDLEAVRSVVGESVNRGDADSRRISAVGLLIEAVQLHQNRGHPDGRLPESHRCVLGANGRSLPRTKTLRRLARPHQGWSHRRHPDEVAKWFENLKPAGPPKPPSRKSWILSIITTRSARRSPIRSASPPRTEAVRCWSLPTDPKAFAERITVNLLA